MIILVLGEGMSPGAGGGRKCHYISEILRLRAHSTSDHLLFTLLNNKGTETLANFRTLRRDNLPGKHFGHWAKIYLLNNYLVQIKL